MADDGLERALRATFTHSVADLSPQTVDLAGAAIRRGRRRQRRRALAGVGLALLAAVGLTSTVVRLQPVGTLPGQIVVIGDPPEADGTSTSSTVQSPHAVPRLVTGALPVPVVVNHVLRQPDGRQVQLGVVGPVERVRGVPGGVLVTEQATSSRRKVWFVGADNRQTVVLADVAALTVDPAGHRIAWTSGSSLTVATLDGGRTSNPVTTSVPAGVSPIRFVGDSLLLHQSGPPSGYTLWKPDRGEFQPIWNNSVSSVYGVLGDGRVVVQQHNPAALGRPCLSLLKPAPALPPDRSVCGLPLAAGDVGMISPSGRRLLVNGNDDQTGGSPRALLSIDLERVFEGALAPAPRPVGPPLAGDGTWTAETLLVYSTAEGNLVRADSGAVGSGDELAGPPQLGGRPLVVTDGS